MDRTVNQPVKGATRPRLRVGFLLADRFTLIAFAGFIDAIRLASDEGDQSQQIDCHWAILGTPGETIRSSCGAAVMPDAAMESPKDYDYIVMVGGLLHGGQKVGAGVYSFLKLASAQHVPLIALCTGSFILARAGLLDGYEVCLSWFHRAEFEQEFPDSCPNSEKMFIVDRDRLTCAGGTSVVHLAAHIIEKHCSRAQAIKSLRIMIEEQPLPSAAWQPEEIITRQATDSLVREVMLLLERDLSERSTLEGVANRFHISSRQLERRFISDIGISPVAYRMRLRLARARWMVEHSDRSMTDIGLECGFNESAYFSRAFKSHYGIAPSVLRRTATER